MLSRHSRQSTPPLRYPIPDRIERDLPSGMREKPKIPRTPIDEQLLKNVKEENAILQERFGIIKVSEKSAKKKDSIGSYYTFMNQDSNRKEKPSAPRPRDE
jgi:hypothetical protein